MREDFIRCEPDEIKAVTNLFDYKLYYQREILNETGKVQNMKVSIEGRGYSAEVFREMGINIATADRKGIISAYIDDNAERLVLSDELGRTITGEKYNVLAAIIAIKSGEKTVVMSNSGSNTIEEIANKYNASTVRCKTQKAQMMECLQKNSVMQFRLMYDAVYALAKICAFLSENSIRLCDLADEIPEIHLVEKEVRCEAGKKGSVIRSIADTAGRQWNGGRIELEEGVKIINDNGWVLIVPHAEKPVCRVISEGTSEEYANELCDIYIKEVERLSE